MDWAQVLAIVLPVMMAIVNGHEGGYQRNKRPAS